MLARFARRGRSCALGGTLIVAGAVDRARYHGGAALVATGAVWRSRGGHSASKLRSRRPRRLGTRAAVASLLRSVASNVEAVGARRALASPRLRDDTDTVARHLAVMPPRRELTGRPPPSSTRLRPTAR